MNIHNGMCASPASTCAKCWLNNFSGFRDCSVEVQEEIVKSTQVQKFSKGTFLAQAGDIPAGVFCIEEGIVKVSKKGKRNKEFILWIAGTGDIVGLNSFINEEPFSFSASAISDVTACFIPSACLKDLFYKEPTIFVQLMKSLCQKLNFIEQRITSISRKNIREQCAEIIISLAAKNNSPAEKNIIDYSIQDLASLIGTTKNYLYKILWEFTSKKILVIQNRKLVINNLKALLLIAMGNEK